MIHNHHRQTQYTHLLVAAVTVFSFLVGFATAATAAQRPNIVIFLVDDMGWQDTSVPFWKETTPFNKRYRTPNMERLVAEGMKFTQAYAACVCSPSRVSLMTGLNAARHRVTNWTLYANNSQEAKHKLFDPPAWNYCGISSSPDTPHAVNVPTLPQLLQDLGYRTIHAGKAHFGAIGTPGADPKNLGFDVNIAGHAAGGPGGWNGLDKFCRNNPNSVWAIPGLEKYHGQNIHLTEALTREANAAMTAAVKENKPFYLYMSHYAVHAPIQKDDRFIANYPDIHPTEASYATMIEGMDKSLGDIMDNLEQLDIADNTIILFMSDNGGLSAAARGGEPHTHNRPLSSGKGSAHEGGVRVPMIVKWPGVTAEASNCNQPVIIEDFFTTILYLANHPDAAKHEQRVDGENFLPLLQGRKRTATINDERALFWHYPNHWGGPVGPGIGAHSAIRKGDWKLIYYHADQSYELFNLEEEIGEVNNLAKENTQIRDQLANELRRYLVSVDAQMPTLKATGEVIPLPGTADVQ